MVGGYKFAKIKQNIYMKKILLYLSAFVPLYFLVLTKLIIEITLQNLTFNILNTTALVLLIIAIICGIFGAKLALKHSDTPSCSIRILKQKSITEQYFLGYFSLFVLFALGFELERVSMFIVFVIVIILIGIVYIKNDLFYINPFLNILGYNFYDITYTMPESDKQYCGKFICKGKLNTTNLYYTALLSHESFSMIKNN